MVMVGVAVAGSVTSNVSGTGVGGIVAVGVPTAMTGEEDGSSSTGGRFTLMVGEGSALGWGVGVLVGISRAKEGVQLPPLINSTSVMTRTMVTAALRRNP